MDLFCGTSAWRRACSSCRAPRVRSRSLELRASELAMILDGIDVSKLKRLPRYQRGAG